MSLKANIKAIIFDMDGVISDTQSLHSSVESELLKEYGVDIHPDEITYRYAGTTSYQMFPHVFSSFAVAMPDLEMLVEEKRRRIDKATHGNVRAVPGTKEFIQGVKAKNLPIAIASASRLEYIDIVVSELGIKESFNALASSMEVENGKPEPDVFLLAASRLGVLPENCVVIEDGIAGMIGAKRGGMQCIGLVRTKDNREYPADLIVSDLRDVQINDYLV